MVIQTQDLAVGKDNWQLSSIATGSYNDLAASQNTKKYVGSFQAVIRVEFICSSWSLLPMAISTCLAARC